jgi:hypothetical protein
MYFGRPVRHADNFVETGFGFQSAQFDALLANVDGRDFFGKNLSRAVGPKDSDRHLDIYSRLPTFPHAI